MRLRVRVERKGGRMARVVIPHLRAAAHYAADKAIKLAKAASRDKIREVGLGKLANAIGATSSLAKGRTEKNQAWGAIYARGGENSRANQALMAYTEGALIRPTGNRRWLAYPTQAAGRLLRLPIPRTGAGGRFGNFKNAPSRIRGLNLQFVQFSPSRAALVLKNASVSRKTGRAKPIGKRLGRGADRKDFVIMFWLIRFTSRAARFNQDAIVRESAQSIPRFAEEYQSKRPLR
jgi:hypothetical protein